MGLVGAVAESFPEARWQRCGGHFYRNVLTEVPTMKGKEVAALLKTIHAPSDTSPQH